MPNVEYRPFLIADTPYCVWDWELRQRNLEFLRGLDPMYYEYLVDAHEPALDGENKQFAALLLRNTYSQALETFFALAGAAVQAPRAVIGYMLKYRSDSELPVVVRGLTNGHGLLAASAKMQTEGARWETLAEMIFSATVGQPDFPPSIPGGFAALWRRFAYDYLQDTFRSEYNSIKHGLRVRPGGFTIATGLEDTPGVPAAPEKMQVIGSSVFGSSFFIAEALDKRNLRPLHRSRNWTPKGMAVAVRLLVMSIGNLRAWLLAKNGAPKEQCEVQWPVDESVFQEPWAVSTGAFESGFNVQLELSDIRPLTADEIRAAYVPRPPAEPPPPSPEA